MNEIIEQLDSGAPWRDFPIATRVDIVVNEIARMADRHGGVLRAEQYNHGKPRWMPTYPYVIQWLGVRWTDLCFVAGVDPGNSWQPRPCDCGSPATRLMPIHIGEDGVWEAGLLLCDDCARIHLEMEGAKTDG